MNRDTRTTGVAAVHTSTPATTPQADTEIVPAPVFVDTTGRRRRALRTTAFAFLALVGAYGVAVALSFLGGPVPPNALLPIPGPPNAPSSSTATGNPNGSTQPTGAAHAGSGTPNTTATSLSGPTTVPNSSSTAAPLPSPSSSRRTPPGKATRSASPGPSGHGR